MATRDINDAHRQGVPPSEATRVVRPPGLEALYEAEAAQDAETASEAYQRALAPGMGTIQALADLPARERDRLLLALSGVAGVRTRARELRRAAEAELRERAQRRREAGARVQADASRLMTGHEHLDLLTVPPGYVATRRGIVRGDGAEEVLVAHRIIAPLRAYEDPASGERFVELAWEMLDGSWRSRIVAAGVLADSRRIVAALAPAGAPVTSTTARAVVDWLAAIMEANGDHAIPEYTGCRRMGWVSDDPADGYLWGSEHIGGSGRAQLVDVPDRLRPLVSAYRAAGTHRDWLRAVWSRVREHPRAAIATYASLAAPLLAVIPEAASLAVELAAGSRTGKGVAIEAALSAWAHPAGAIGRWDSTPKGIGLRGAFHPSMPLVMEDSKLADRNGQLDTGKIAEVIYAFTNTGLRMRTGEDGRLDVVEPVRGVLLTAGEQAYADAAADAQGAIARTLTLRGSPWETVSRETARTVDGVRHAAELHHGHTGPAVVRWLIEGGPERAAAVRTEYRECRETIALGDAGTAQAAAGHIALLWTSAWVAERAAGMAPPAGLWEALLDAAEASALSADTAYRAMSDVLGWLATDDRVVLRASKAASWESEASHRRDTPPGGWVALADPKAGTLDVRASALDDALRRMGYQPGNVRGLWTEAGWIEPGTASRWWAPLSGTVRGVRVLLSQLPDGLRLE